MSKANLDNLFFMELLNDNLWPASGAMSRSTELSPLYVSRYSGLRINRDYTCHNHYELLCVIRGKGEFCSKLDGESIPLARDTVLLIPEGLEHYEFSSEPMDAIWIGLIGSKTDELSSRLIVDRKSFGLSDLFEQSYFEAKRQNENCGSILDSLVGLLLAKLLSKQSSEINVGIEQAMRYLHDNFNQEINISDLAYELGYSEGYFYRLFKKHCNVTPGDFLAGIRIEHAIEMIRQTRLPFGEIAEKCGINDGLYFSKLIRKKTGKSPRQLRQLLIQVERFR